MVHIFTPSIEKTVFVKHFCAKLLSQSPSDKNVEDLADKVVAFCLHFLSRGSLLPIISNSEKGFRSPFDYEQPGSNSPTYYRGDGSPIHARILSKLMDGIGFDLTKYRCGVIKPSSFRYIMKLACKSIKFKKSEVDDINCMEGDDNAFYDISNWIEGELKKDWSNIHELGQCAQAQANKLGNTTIVGGVFKLRAHFGIYVFWTSNDSLELTDSSSTLNGLVGDFLNLRGNFGAFPEMIESKSILAKQINRFEKWQLPNFADTINPLPGIEKKQIEETIENLRSFEDSPFEIYVKIVIKWLGDFNIESYNFQTNDYKFSSILYSLEKIKNNVLNLKELNFYDQLQGIYLIVEEVIFLSLFFKPCEYQSFEKDLLHILPKHNDIQNVLGFNSGMTCYQAIFEVACNTITSKDRICTVVKGSYYELQEDIYQYLPVEWEMKTLDPASDIDPAIDADLLLLDLYPNDVNLPELRENPVTEIISKAVQSRDQDHPLTVVLDTSTALLTDAKVMTVIDEFSHEIDQGSLNLLIVTSLAKFYSCGLDKYTGGAIALVGKPDGSQQRKKLWINLTTQKSNDIISNEARRFFSLLFQQAKEEIQTFYDSVLGNTDKLHELLKERDIPAGLVIKEKDFRIPMIGITTDDSLGENKQAKIEALQYSLSREAINKGLSLLVRASFPFPHSGLIECGESLRLVVGLDDTDKLSEYVKVFQDCLDHSAR